MKSRRSEVAEDEQTAGNINSPAHTRLLGLVPLIYLTAFPKETLKSLFFMLYLKSSH